MAAISVSARDRAAFFRTYPIVLRINPARMMMIAMTTSNSTRLNAVVVAGVSPALGRILQPARPPLQARSCAAVERRLYQAPEESTMDSRAARVRFAAASLG